MRNQLAVPHEDLLLPHPPHSRAPAVSPPSSLLRLFFFCFVLITTMADVFSSTFPPAILHHRQVLVPTPLETQLDSASFAVVVSRPEVSPTRYPALWFVSSDFFHSQLRLGASPLFPWILCAELLSIRKRKEQDVVTELLRRVTRCGEVRSTKQCLRGTFVW